MTTPDLEDFIETVHTEAMKLFRRHGLKSAKRSKVDHRPGPDSSTDVMFEYWFTETDAVAKLAGALPGARTAPGFLVKGGVSQDVTSTHFAARRVADWSIADGYPLNGAKWRPLDQGALN
jgi:hypothetical protein